MAAERTQHEHRNPDSPGTEPSLRNRAEQQLAHTLQHSPRHEGQTAEALIHELQVHQIELEMQAEELRRSHLALEESRDQYLDLYEFAPLGYLTLNEKGLVTAANLTGATLLGIERSTLVKSRFSKFIAESDADVWHHYFRNVLQQEEKQSCTLTLLRGVDSLFPARLESIRIPGISDRRPSVRVAISDISDIRLAEGARRESEELLKTVIDLLPAGVLILDENGKTVVINPEAERIWGSARSCGTGRFPEYKCWRLEDGIRIEPRDWAGARAIYNGEITLEEQIEIESTTGAHKIVLNSALPIRIGYGGISGAVVVTQDITEGKAAEEQIRWLASFPELDQNPVIELDMEGAVTFANTATKTILDELGLPNDPSVFVPADGNEILQLLRNGSDPQIYREITLADEIFAENIALETGLQVIRIYARNITGYKRAEDALKESEEFNRSLVEHLPDFIVVCGPDLEILYVNPSVERILGKTAHRLEGSSVLGYIPEQEHNRVARKIHDLFSGDTIARHEIEILARNRTYVWVILQGKPIQYHGSPAMLLLLTDITERKILEDALKKEAVKLSLLSNAFQTANRKLQLLSGLTRHDINNHLTVVLGHLALFSEDPAGTIRPDVVGKVLAASRHIADLIAFMKTYEEIGVKAPVFTDARQLVETATHSLSGTLRFENELPPGREIFADPLIVKVFFNLMDNAVRYGGTITTIRFSGEEQDGDFVITCEDDGIGIAADQKEKIFERGYGQNTGLGLFLAREILSITGITIHETGEPGRGARFEMRVPRGMWHTTG
ncbi:MAG: PAS domain S-box protein [Methanoregula sp.]|nr:PAS domain S-box protein [Methanoregula sp.]